VPGFWKAMIVLLVVCLVASMVIATVRLITTPTEILGDGFQGWHGKQFPR
jgi:Na+-transporting NADH:ubiquinone oxidoreductase subunit NqrC